jgi:hypothetical protein
MTHICDVQYATDCLIESDSDSNKFVDVEYSDDAKWHLQGDRGTYNQESKVMCWPCFDALWGSRKNRIISVRRILRPHGGTS